MSQITINNINGLPPYQIFVCDINQYNCILSSTVSTTVPPSINVTIPKNFDNAPIFLVKIVDSNNCVFTYNYSCQTPTLTPTNTQTLTPTSSITSTPTVTPSITPSSQTPTPTPTISITPSITPSISPSISITPSVSPTNTPTPTVTITLSVTPTITPTTTATPTITPTITPTPYASPSQTPTITPSLSITPSSFQQRTLRYNFLIFAEPLSGAAEIAEYMYSANTGTTFFGFSNGTLPSTNPTLFNKEMNDYVKFYGFDNELSGFKVFYNQTYENEVLYGGIGVDRNFRLTTITANTLPMDAWYTIMITTAFTLNQYQSVVGVGINNSESLTPIIMDSDYYKLSFTLSGDQINYLNATYRVYMTYPSTDLLLNNNENILYFKGLGLTS